MNPSVSEKWMCVTDILGISFVRIFRIIKINYIIWKAKTLVGIILENNRKGPAKWQLELEKGKVLIFTDFSKNIRFLKNKIIYSGK